jgi:hypothetical protein
MDPTAPPAAAYSSKVRGVLACVDDDAVREVGTEVTPLGVAATRASPSRASRTTAINMTVLDVNRIGPGPSATRRGHDSLLGGRVGPHNDGLGRRHREVADTKSPSSQRGRVKVRQFAWRADEVAA